MNTPTVLVQPPLHTSTYKCTSFDVSLLEGHPPLNYTVYCIKNHLLIYFSFVEFLSVREQVELDSLYLRSCIEHTPTSNREMTLKKGSLLRVVNKFVHAPNYWLAWAVDERTGVETQLKRIPSPI